MKNKKSQVTIYVMFIFVAILIVIIAAVLAPLGVLINTEFYKAGESILLQANSTLQDINDPTAKAQIQDSINSAFAAQENNIEVNANFFQYSWILVIGLTGLIMFLFTRKTVEYGSGGFI